MPNRIKITIASNPVQGNQLVFSLQNVSPAYSNTQGFVFVNGVPTNNNQIKIGATAADTLNNLYLQFLLAFSNLIITKVFPDVFIDFPTPGDYTVTTLVNTTGGALTVGAETFTEEPEDPDAVFEIKDFSIEVIDTYDNDRALQVEISRQSACKLIFDSGDSIMEPIMASELKFDMRSLNFQDAYFKHLFTGDEKRFKVKLNGIDPEENIKLLWQGFLLPDLGREPYVNGNLFVEFSATDMIGTLKGKYFKPWEYHRKINIMRLLAEIMAQTGINQNFIVMPGMVPESLLLPWYYLNLELSVYYDGKKGENLYSLLESVLRSNLLSIRSYEGFWWIEAANRKFDLTGTALVFDAAGVYQNEQNFERIVQNYNFSKDSLFITPKSPLKEVSIDFSGENTNNLFPEDIVNREAFFGTWTDNEWDETTQKTSVLDYWQRFGAFYLQLQSEHRFVFKNVNLVGTNYIVTEADQLVNYFKCLYRPYVLSGREYRFKMTAELKGEIFQSFAAFNDTFIPNGGLRHFFVYQLLLNGTEVYSNRYSFGYNGDNLFFINPVSYVQPYDHTIEFILDAVVSFPENGFLELRILAPNSERAGLNNLFLSRAMSVFQFEIKKLELVPEEDLSLSLTAVRPINYTSKYNQENKLVSTTEIGASDNFGLGLQLQPYETTIPVGTQVYVENIHTFNSNAVNKIFSWRFEILLSIEIYLFKKLRSKSCYLTRANGEQDFFNSIYTKRINNASGIPYPYLFYLTDKVGSPKIPKEYKYIDKIQSGDVLSFLLSDYPEEDLGERLKWRIVNEISIQNFVQTLAKIIHQIHPETFYFLEGTALGLVFPGEVLEMYYDGDNRQFVTSRLEIDLFNGKTAVTAREIKYEQLTDISYE